MSFQRQTALVVGASSGFGRGVVESLVANGMTVTAVARNRERLEDLARNSSAKIIAADATDERATEQILSETKPNLLVLSAGTRLDLRPLHEHTWETFSRAWEVDTKITFLWVRAALRAKEGPQHVVVFGSGAALFGSQLSGGYAGAKKMNAVIAEYAMGVASRAKLPIRFHCLIPPMSPHTEFGGLPHGHTRKCRVRLLKTM
jgi:NAD(P)-dependent dehydrogenase (short-subunit alcohol dehydrogenase family)